MSFTEYSFAQFRFLVLSLCVLSVLCVNISAQDWKTVHDGVEYAEVSREFSGKPVNINLLRLDLKKVRLDVHHAMDAAIGTEKTSSIATRHRAFAAINGGFFRLDKSEFAGEASDTLMIDGQLLSEGDRWRIALEIDNSEKPPEVHFHRLSVWPEFARTFVNGMFLSLDGVNRERNKGEVILYTPQFNSRTLTSLDGTEAVFSGCSRSIAKRDFYISCSNVEIRENQGNSNIAPDGYVISMSKDATVKMNQVLEAIRFDSKGFRRKTKLIFSFSVFEFGHDLGVSQQTDIVAGVPQLIKNRKIDITWEQEKASKSFVETRHPRTAVAKLTDGKFLMLTADGRSDVSAGLDLYDLAKYMLELGAVDAMNLDGGGSTTMFLDGKVVNKPSDPAGERKIGDAILVTLRKPKRK